MNENEALEILEIELKRYRRHMAGTVDESILNDSESLASLIEEKEKSEKSKKPTSRIQEALKIMRKSGKFKKK